MIWTLSISANLLDKGYPNSPMDVWASSRNVYEIEYEIVYNYIMFILKIFKMYIKNIPPILISIH